MGFLLLPVIGIVYFIGIIIAIVKTRNGQVYQLPFTINFLSKVMVTIFYYIKLKRGF
ncbi:DUF4870 domain-containing protein [Anoxybacillus flavithermus]|uniref:DUF4870 domain-containing protein n=1 Tax=Anoxybacillus flavithermus TaxID=33934 RepID=UPI0034DEC750